MKERAKTGDLILFSGHSGDSAVSKAWTACHYSHVGMIVRPSESSHPGLQVEGGPDLYLWNANVNEQELCAFQGLTVKGVQLNDLEMTIHQYHGWALFQPLDQALTPGQLQRLWLMIEEHTEKPFRQSLIELFRCALPWARWPQRPVWGKDFVCSELLLETFHEMGLLNRGKNYPSNEYHPACFSNPWRLHWNEGNQVGPIPLLIDH